MKKWSLFVLVFILILLCSSALFASPLIEAIEAGDIDGVKKYIENEIDKYSVESGVQDEAQQLSVERALIESLVNTRFGQETPLISAIRHGNLEIVKFLVSKGADVNLDDEYDVTPLHIAAKHGQLETAKFLVSKGAEVDSKDNLSITPLWYAALYGAEDIANFLISRGADINVRSDFGKSLLQAASIGGLLDLMKVMLYRRVDEDELNTTLLLASMAGRAEAVRFLLDQRANLRFHDSGMTPFTAAARYGHIGVMQLLMKKGVGIDETNSINWTALLFAARSCRVEAVRFLIAEGADVNANDNFGRTVLMYAASPFRQGDDPFNKEVPEKEDCLDILRLLIASGANINERAIDDNNSVIAIRVIDYDEKGFTALMYAARGGRIEIAGLLLDSGADINFKSDDGIDALLIAVREGDSEMVELLIDRGADINTKDANGRTPLIYAVKWKHVSIFETLIEKGANVNEKDKGGRTALSYAEEMDPSIYFGIKEDMINSLEKKGAKSPLFARIKAFFRRILK
jgi:ankyrin repeat protein